MKDLSGARAQGSREICRSHRVSYRWWRVYLCAGAAVLAGYLVVPEGVVRDLVYLAVGFSSAAMIALAVRLHSPLRRAPWWWMAAGQATWSVGDGIYSWLDDVRHVSPFPSSADLCYLGAYLMLGMGFLLLVRGRRGSRDREGLLDSSVFTVGLGLLSWVFLMRPVVTADGSSITERTLGLAYPLADILLFALLIRLLATPGGRTPAFRLLCGAGASLLAADTLFAILNLQSAYTGGAVDLLWLGSYVLWGAAALHPSMRSLSEPAPDRALPFTRRRLLALTGASITSPGTLAVQLVLGMALDGWAVVISSVVLFLLVIARMSGLFTQLQQQAVELDVLARSDALTGLPNRRSADGELARTCGRVDASGDAVTVAMVDLDRFKAFNDTYGHQAGDRLLAEAAATWRTRLAGRGVLARYGGEEFVVILTGFDLDEAVSLLDVLRTATPAGQTFSAGVARWDGQESPAALMHRADVALYEAKRAGRNQVLAAGNPLAART